MSVEGMNRAAESAPGSLRSNPAGRSSVPLSAQPAPIGSPADPPPTRPVPLWLALALSGAGGAAGYLAFPRFSLWWLAPLSLALLALAVRGRRPAAAAGLGYLHGWAMLAPLLSWTSIQVGALPWLALVALQASFHALGGWALCLVLRVRPTMLRWALVGSCWVAVETLQDRIPFGGFGWSRYAFTQSEAPTLGLAALAGTAALTFAVGLAAAALVEATLALAALARRRRGTRPDLSRRRNHNHSHSHSHRPGLRRLPLAAAWLAVTALVLGAGLLVPKPVTAEQGDLNVLGIQGNVPRMGLEFNAERRAVLDNHAQLTMASAEQVAAGSRPRPDLVVWPENASDIDPFTNPDAYRAIETAADAAQTPMLIGTLIRNPETGLIRNTVLQWRPGEGPVAAYAKRAPVPFAEYVPYRSFFRAITPLVDQAGNMEAGGQVGLMPVQTDAGQVRAGVLICFEVVPDRLVDDVVAAGANLLVVPTNNATFGFTDESVQQLAISRVRAVQTGRSVVHVSTVGVSALIAPDGTLLDASSLFEPTALQAELPLRDSMTLASRLQSGPQWALTVLALVGIGLGLRAGRATTDSTTKGSR